MSPDKPLLEAKALTVRAGPHPVCEGLNVVLQPGETLALIGRNGAGKSTLLQALAGLHPSALHHGTLYLQGRPLNELSARQRALIRGYCPQNLHEPFASTSVREAVLLGRHPHLSRFAWESDADHRQVITALERVDMAHMAERELATLSGGERQRVAMATLLAQSPHVYFLDEPLAHLDLHHQVHTLLLFQEEAAKGKAVVMVIHDVNWVARFAKTVLILDGKGGHALGPCARLLTVDGLSKAFGHPLTAIEDPHNGRFFIPKMP